MSVVVLSLTVWVGLRYGGRGASYPDLSGPPIVPDEALEVVVSSPEPIGNVAVTADGRVFYTVHPEGRPPGPKLWVHEAGTSRPFLDPAQQNHLFQTPLGLVADERGRLWVIDHGLHGLGRPRLVGIDVSDERIVYDHLFDREAAPRGSFLQDLQVTRDGRTAIVADVSFVGQRPGFVVVDLEEGRAWRRLDGHPSVVAQGWRIRTALRDMVFLGGLVRFRIGVDGLALDSRDEWLVYGAMVHDTLYRVPTAALLDRMMPEGEVAATVEELGPKPLNDGLSVDLEGNTLITDVEHGAVLRRRIGGELETLVRSERIRWADGLSHGPEGWLYLADSALPDLVLRTRGQIRDRGPYFIYRFRTGVDGLPGR